MHVSHVPEWIPAHNGHNDEEYQADRDGHQQDQTSGHQEQKKSFGVVLNYLLINFCSRMKSSLKI